MLTTRTDRLIALITFLVVFALVLAIPAAFGALGPFEILVLIVLAIPISIVVTKAIQSRFERVTPPHTG